MFNPSIVMMNVEKHRKKKEPYFTEKNLKRYKKLKKRKKKNFLNQKKENMLQNMQI